MNSVVYVNASQPQHIPAGELVGKMHYSGFLDKVLSHNEYSGYPHNGGEHSLSLSMAPRDLGSFLSLVQEHFRTHEGVSDFIASVKARLSQKYPMLRAI